jgi:predicted RNA-binding Zn-ribbon protein involved in translation (DUF1610 family)
MKLGNTVTWLLYAAALGAFVAFGWVAGLILAAIATFRFARRVVRFRRALAETTTCPACRADVPQYGAFSCGPCGARTLGWVWRCRWCGAWAGYTACPSCTLSVANPAIRELD